MSFPGIFQIQVSEQRNLICYTCIKSVLKSVILCETLYLIHGKEKKWKLAKHMVA